ncbi:MAG: potassium transporter TrkA [Clostridiales bacterium GWF2_38_85]|nr:MAG: potassium transporter TrkA [Clostridiales bacterium GWF2_38_85]HBL83834.1 TrkA family potassium uptake protein [Clostridiales bacterium]
MNKKNKDITYGIIGLGRFGTALAQTLADCGKDVIVLDKNEAKIKSAREFTEHAFIVGELTKEVLEEVGIHNCDTVIVCMGEQVDVSIMTTLIVVNMGVKRVIAKATSPEQGMVLEKLGAEVIYPERDSAIRLAHKLVSSRVMEYISLNEDLDISEIKMTAKVGNKTVGDANLRKRYGLNIIAVKQDGNTQIDITPELELHENDIIVAVGKRANIMRFEEYLQK